MEQVHIDRLERLHALALAIAANPEKRRFFDLDCWVQQDYLYDTDFFPGHELVKLDDDCVTIKEGSCNTAACMIGWAATDPGFRAEGFCLRGITSPEPHYHRTGDRGWSAVREFFGMDTDTAHTLFMTERYGKRATPLDVAARIRNVIDNGGRYVEA